MKGTESGSREKYLGTSDDELENLGKEKDYLGKTVTELKEMKGGYSYYQHVLKHRKHLLRKLFRREKNDLINLSDEKFEMLGREKGYQGKTCKEIKEIEGGSGYYCHALRRRKHIFSNLFTRGRQDYKKLSDEEFETLGRERGYLGKTRKELKGMEGGYSYYHHAAAYRRHIFDKFLRANKLKSIETLSDEQFETFGREKGYVRKSLKQLKEMKGGKSYYEYARIFRKHMLSQLFRRERRGFQRRSFHSLSDEEFKALGREKGYLGKTCSEIERIEGGESYYNHALNYRKHICGQLFSKGRNDFISLSDEEFVALGREKDYLEKTRKALSVMEGGVGYYQHAQKHRKDIFNKLFRRRVNKLKSISSQMKSNPELAEHIVKLCHGDESDIADVLAVVFDTPRERVLDLLRKPSVRGYLGKTNGPAGADIIDIGRAAEALYEKYKDEIILEKLRKTLRKYSRERLGPMPKEEDFERLSMELEGAIA